MNRNGQYKISIENRITRLEVSVTEIVENHLPHLESKVDRLTWLLVSTLASGLISLLILLSK